MGLIFWNEMDGLESEKHHRGLLDKLLHLRKELRGYGTIDHAVVGREAEVHA